MIQGNSFGSDLSKLTVLADSKPCKILSMTFTQIVCEV